MINIFKILIRYFDELLNEDEKKLLIQTSKLCENIEFNKINKDELRCFKIKIFCSSIDMLKFAIDERNKNKYIVKQNTTHYLGNVEMFEYIKNNYRNIEYTICTFANAALNGNLENMIWLKENGCLWNEKTFENAASNGNLENMKWLKENGCPISEYTRRNIKKKYNIDI